MPLHAVLRDTLRPVYARNHTLKTALKRADSAVDLVRHSVGQAFPQTIRPDPRFLYLTLTADCNLRCKGCHYGRDFMPGHELELELVKGAIDDAAEAGFERVRLYGGEPLIHRDLPEMVSYIAERGMEMWLTTNGILLKGKLDRLYEAGLRYISLGFYGTGEGYNAYVQRPDRFQKVEASVAYARERYGDSIGMHLDWLLMRPTSTLAAFDETWAFAERYGTPIYINLIHYSLPYFVHESAELQFREEDRPALERLVEHILERRQERPDLIANSEIGLRSIPDWLIKGPQMRVPCSEYRLIWVGPDGTVQMCYVTFKLGNLHEKRLSQMLFTQEHRDAARDAFALNCPNCHCSYDKRVQAHGPSRRLYAGRSG
ncbi:radical SAM protein [Afifella sp. IM 167]|uniref:radical SAM protein n=1 Tax=Afifella sp. IM 167 TaxID=2033586 RepID=UPI001CC99D7F|nr:radical SAM protein [Afifella sp. IM 167]MBZ8134548.1 hypothetical protein [Afifella sp. IM 167]